MSGFKNENKSVYSGLNSYALVSEVECQVFDLAQELPKITFHPKYSFGGCRFALDDANSKCYSSTWAPGYVYAYSLESGAQLWKSKVNQPGPLLLSPDGRLLVVEQFSGRNPIFDTSNGTIVTKIPGGEIGNWVNQDKLVIQRKNRVIEIFDWKLRKTTNQFFEENTKEKLLCSATNERYLVARRFRSDLHVYDIKSGDLKITFKIDDNRNIVRVKWLSVNDFLAYGMDLKKREHPRCIIELYSVKMRARIADARLGCYLNGLMPNHSLLVTDKGEIISTTAEKFGQQIKNSEINESK